MSQPQISKNCFESKKGLVIHVYQNVVIGTTLVPPWQLFANSEEDWAEHEQQQTLFTDTRLLSKVLVEAGLAPSVGEVRRNQPKLHVALSKPDFFIVKWGKKYLNVAVGPSVPEEQWDGVPEFVGVKLPSPRPRQTPREIVLHLLHTKSAECDFCYVQHVNGSSITEQIPASSALNVVADFPVKHQNDGAWAEIYYKDILLCSYHAGDPKWKIEIQD